MGEGEEVWPKRASLVLCPQARTPSSPTSWSFVFFGFACLMGWKPLLKHDLFVQGKDLRGHQQELLETEAD